MCIPTAVFARILYTRYTIRNIRLQYFLPSFDLRTSRIRRLKKTKKNRRHVFRTALPRHCKIIAFSAARPVHLDLCGIIACSGVSTAKTISVTYAGTLRDGPDDGHIGVVSIFIISIFFFFLITPLFRSRRRGSVPRTVER